MKKHIIVHITSYFIIIASIAAIILFKQYAYKNEIYDNNKLILKNSSEQISSFITEDMNIAKTNLKSNGDLLSIILTNPLNKISKDKLKYISSIFSGINKSSNIVSSAYYIEDYSGNSISSTGITKLNSLSDIRNRDWYIKSKYSTSPIISDVYPDISSNNDCITISYAVRKNDVVLGIIVYDLYLYDINNYVISKFNNDTCSSFILSPNGKAIFDNNDKQLIRVFQDIQRDSAAGPLLNSNKVRQGFLILWNKMNQGNSGYINYENNNDEKISAFFSDIAASKFKLVTIANNENFETLLSDNLKLSAYIGMTAAVILILLINPLINKALKFNVLTLFNSKYKLINDIKIKSILNQSTSILFISIKNSARINYDYGNYAADELISKYGRFLKKTFIGKAVIYNPYDNDFCLLFNDNDADNILDLINKKFNELNSFEFNIKGKQIKPQLLYAYIKLNSENMKDFNRALPKIEKILNEKNYDDDNFINCDLEMLTEEEEKSERLLYCLEQAIEKDRIVPFFQKIVNVKTGEDGRYEVLMRIKSGNEYLSPYPFIVTAEKYNLIDKVDLIMLEKAISYKKKIDIQDKLIFSFNLSGKLLNNREYLNKAIAIIDKYNIKHENIIFEITETENINNIKKFANTINEYNKEKFKFSIDDFGTGYSSIYYLKNINVDYLKIDGSFIKDINEKQENIYLVKSIINMAKAFNTKIVAEFVENQNILKTLNNLGVDFAQGYFFDKPKENITVTSE